MVTRRGRVETGTNAAVERCPPCPHVAEWSPLPPCSPRSSRSRSQARRPRPPRRPTGRSPPRSPSTGSAPRSAPSSSSGAPRLPSVRSTCRSPRSRSTTRRARGSVTARTPPQRQWPRPPTTCSSSTSRCPAPALDADLAASLALVPDGKKEDAGVAIGAAAADAMIASRADDGRFDPQYAYTKTAAIGVWPAAAVPGGMAFPWLGFVDPVVDVAPVALDGPDPVSQRRLRDRLRGGPPARAEDRVDADPEQTAIAEFFAANSIADRTATRCATCSTPSRWACCRPPGCSPGSTRPSATAFIQTWRLKYEVGFWRPAQAIAAGATDGNDGTNPHPETWVPLVTNPAYSDYTSGHAAATSPFARGRAPHVRRRHPARAQGQRRPSAATPPSPPSSTTP